MPIKQREVIDFIPTEHSSAEDKRKFYDHFIKFVEKDFPISMFHEWFYKRLSMCFGHIAHYNRAGFYGTWFSDDSKKLAFLNNVFNFPCYGLPQFTYCDVERQLQFWLANTETRIKYEERRLAQIEKAERAELSRLQAKYGKS